jgi:NADPH:quinone reductase-like Zn-dependent oxidoreductase
MSRRFVVKAVQFHEYGGPSALRLDEVDRPSPGPGQVLVKVAGTSFNPVDASFRAGFMRQAVPVRLPHIPGLDVAGTIAELGEGVSGPAVGEAVFGFLPMTDDGAAAEYSLAAANILAPAPASIPLADAAAVPAVALTAWQALHEHAVLRAGQRILINGAGGAVGFFAIQFAKQIGATVIATASPRSRDSVAAAGADQIVDHTTSHVTDTVGTPVDAVLNLIRTDDAAMAALVGLIANGGVLVSTGSPAQEDAERKVRTISMYVRSDAAQLAGIARLIDAGTVKVGVAGRYPLAETAKVHELSAADRLRGKVVITVP